MAKIAILTDSTANLPKEWVEQYNVRVIPLKIHWGYETSLDGIDITPNEFYTRLTHSRSLPTTSQPSIEDFLQAFESLADQADSIIVPLISSGISGTVHRLRPPRVSLPACRWKLWIPASHRPGRRWLRWQWLGRWHKGNHFRKYVRRQMRLFSACICFLQWIHWNIYIAAGG